MHRHSIFCLMDDGIPNTASESLAQTLRPLSMSVHGRTPLKKRTRTKGTPPPRSSSYKRRWFVTQCIAQRVRGLLITELLGVAFASLNFVIYGTVRSGRGRHLRQRGQKYSEIPRILIVAEERLVRTVPHAKEQLMVQVHGRVPVC